MDAWDKLAKILESVQEFPSDRLVFAVKTADTQELIQLTAGDLRQLFKEGNPEL